jgi:tetratricopeptide (TPR) repeat protein
MEALARQALPHADSNPEMYFLFGNIYHDQGWRLRREKRFEEALALFSRAIEYGEQTDFFQERARTYLDLHEPELALADADQGVLLSPTAADPYRVRATVQVNLGDWEAARRDIAMAERLSPDDPDIRSWYKWASQRALRLGHDVFKDDLTQAIVAYDAAIDFDPECHGAYYWRGVAYSKTGRPDLALADCRRAVAGDPGLFEAYRMLDHLLAREGKWEEVLAYWDRYLALEPDNADAYFERAGTYRHKGDMNKAFADLKRACELGNQEACRLYGRSK